MPPTAKAKASTNTTTGNAPLTIQTPATKIHPHDKSAPSTMAKRQNHAPAHKVRVNLAGRIPAYNSPTGQVHIYHQNSPRQRSHSHPIQAIITGTFTIERPTAMAKMNEQDVFTDHASRNNGFTESFWLKALDAHYEAAHADPSRDIEKFFCLRRTRLSHNGQDFDVYSRVQPRPYEYPVFRFSAFPAQDPPEEKRPADTPLGQALIPDAGHAW